MSTLVIPDEAAIRGPVCLALTEKSLVVSGSIAPLPVANLAERRSAWPLADFAPE